MNDMSRGVDSFEIEAFEEDVDVFRATEKAIINIEALIDNKILNLLKQAQASLMRDFGVKQAASIGMSWKLQQSITTAFEKIRDAVHEDVSDEFHNLSRTDTNTFQRGD